MPRTYQDLLADARSRIREISLAEFATMRGETPAPVVVDVREANEANLGTIPGAIHLSRGNLESLVESTVPRDARVVVFCTSGSRSALSASTLLDMGYAHVVSLQGGIRAWVDAGGDID